MKKITISVDDKVFEATRKYAEKHNLSLNTLIRKLLAQTVIPTSQNWLDECFSLMDQGKANSYNIKWNRDELYDKSISERLQSLL